MSPRRSARSETHRSRTTKIQECHRFSEAPIPPSSAPEPNINTVAPDKSGNWKSENPRKNDLSGYATNHPSEQRVCLIDGSHSAAAQFAQNFVFAEAFQRESARQIGSSLCLCMHRPETRSRRECQELRSASSSERFVHFLFILAASRGVGLRFLRRNPWMLRERGQFL